MAEETERASVVDTLTHMERKFVDGFLLFNGNKTKAARYAKYKHPHVKGSQLYKKPKIRAAIDEVLFAETMSRNEVLHGLTRQARASMEDFVEFEMRTAIDEETGEVVIDEETGEPLQEYTGGFWVDLLKAKQAGVLDLVKELQEDKKVFVDKQGNKEVTYKHRVKLVDKQAAHVHLGRYYSLFTDKVQHEGKVEVPFTAVIAALQKAKSSPEVDETEESGGED